MKQIPLIPTLKRYGGFQKLFDRLKHTDLVDLKWWDYGNSTVGGKGPTACRLELAVI